MKTKIWQRITPNNWCKESECTRNGRRCAIGWIEKVYGYDGKQREIATGKLEFYLSKKLNRSSIIGWNEDKETTCKDVKAAFKAINI